jgi:hypothetical protein
MVDMKNSFIEKFFTTSAERVSSGEHANFFDKVLSGFASRHNLIKSGGGTEGSVTQYRPEGSFGRRGNTPTMISKEEIPTGQIRRPDEIPKD